jgi:hypothetical protein
VQRLHLGAQRVALRQEFGILARQALQQGAHVAHLQGKQFTKTFEAVPALPPLPPHTQHP